MMYMHSVLQECNLISLKTFYKHFIFPPPFSPVLEIFITVLFIIRYYK